MTLASLHDKEHIERFFRRNTFLHIYGIGDLDDFFWERTVWYALKHSAQVEQIILLYTGFNPPVVLALSSEPMDSMRHLLRSALPLLPRRFYAHLSEGLADILEEDYRVRPHGL